MFAIAFDMTVAQMEKLHPRGVRAGYDEIVAPSPAMTSLVQGSVYHCMNEDLANLNKVMNALKALPWLPASVHAFRIELWSDYTSFFKE